MKKNEQGYALLITTFAIVLLSVLGIGMMTVSSNTLKTSTYERSNQSLYYLAEAGINYKEAIILDEIKKIYDEEKANTSNQTGSEDTFNNTFNHRLTNLLLSENNSELDQRHFLNHSNGDPVVKITIVPKGSPRQFTIKSEATLSGTSGKRTVQRDYKLPLDLLTVTTTEVPIEPENNQPKAEDNVIGNAPITDYRNVKGNLYVRDKLIMSLVNKKNNNAQYYVPYKYRWLISEIEITNNGNIDLIKYDSKLPSFPTSKVTYVSPPSTSTSPITKINLNQHQITMEQDLQMQSLSNFSNRIVNIHVPSGEHDLVFTENFLHYNFSSLRFNVTGNGTLNIVFNKYFELNLYRKFIVNAPNTKVNLIFKDGTTIRGEMVAQDLYVKGRLEPTLDGKLVANNIYISEGTFDKDFQSQVKIKDLYIKQGSLRLSSPTAFYANHITIEDGNIVLNTWSQLSANSIYVKNGYLRSHLTTCVQAETISVPNGTTRFDDEANFSNYYGIDLYMIGSSKINKTVCGKSPVIISPDVQDETPKTKIEIRYDFKESDNIEIGNLIEIKS